MESGQLYDRGPHHPPLPLDHPSLSDTHLAFLKRCCDLARIPGAAVEPNPRVGAVVVHRGRIVGEGAHAAHGGPHAEVVAVASVQDPSLLRESTLYVSLEPCNHHGKTPPCTELILAHGITRVVVGAVDPNPRMQGRSIAFLRERGVAVHVLAEGSPCVALNPHFDLNQRLGRPYVVLKWAESADGFIAGRDAEGKPSPRAISGAASNRFFHRLRHELQAIWIGKNTAAIDNPSLTTRLWPGRDPLRIVMDPQLSLPQGLSIFQGPPTLRINGLRDGQEGNVRLWKVEDSRDLPALLRSLYAELKVGSVLVEGGADLSQQFIDAGLWDEVYRCQSPLVLGDGVAAPVLPTGLQPADVSMLGSDRVSHFLQGR